MLKPQKAAQPYNFELFLSSRVYVTVVFINRCSMVPIS